MYNRLDHYRTDFSSPFPLRQKTNSSIKEATSFIVEDAGQRDEQEVYVFLYVKFKRLPENPEYTISKSLEKLTGGYPTSITDDTSGKTRGFLYRFVDRQQAENAVEILKEGGYRINNRLIYFRFKPRNPRLDKLAERAIRKDRGFRLSHIID